MSEGSFYHVSPDTTGRGWINKEGLTYYGKIDWSVYYINEKVFTGSIIECEAYIRLAEKNQIKE